MRKKEKLKPSKAKKKEFIESYEKKPYKKERKK